MPTWSGGSRADGPCYNDNEARYQDCDNGTVTDTVTGLTWLKQADCLGAMSWSLANQAAAALADGTCELSDGSTAGDWRLPTTAEWDATVFQARDINCEAPVLTDMLGTGCHSSGEAPFTNVGSDYWSSVTDAAIPNSAAAMCLDYYGFFRHPLKSTDASVWPVRSAR